MVLCNPEEKIKSLEDHIKSTHPKYKPVKYFINNGLIIVKRASITSSDITGLKKVFYDLTDELNITNSFKNFIYEGIEKNYLKREDVDSLLAIFRAHNYILFNSHEAYKLEKRVIKELSLPLICNPNIEKNVYSKIENKELSIKIIDWINEYNIHHIGFEIDQDLEYIERKLIEYI